MDQSGFAVISIVVSAIAVLVAPIVALWVGGCLQKRSDEKKDKLRIFGTLLATRHDEVSQDSIRCLNLIDAIFSRDIKVREAWSRYFSVINDQNLNNPIGWSIRAEKRRDMLLEMAKAVSMDGKISSSDLLRAYVPKIVGEQSEIQYKKILVEKHELNEKINVYNIDDPFK